MTTTVNSLRSTKPVPFTGIAIGIAVVLAIILGAFLYFSQSSAVSTAAAITASGGNGKAATAGAEFNVSITASINGSQCEYKPFWSDGTQIGSGFIFSCDETGYQNLLSQLKETNKIGEGIYNALKAVKFW